MRRYLNSLTAIAAIIAIPAFEFDCSAQPQPAQALQKIEIVRLDPRFDELVPLNVQVERIVSGRKWVEGPVWNRKEGYLLFSDIPANSVIKWQQGKGTSVFLRPSGYTGKTPFEGPEPGSNGLVFDPEGRLVLAEHGDRRIGRLESNGQKTTLVDRFEDKRINSPNDLVFKSNGDLYFTDPPFGLPKSFDDPRKDTPFQGVYKYSKDGKLALLTRDIKAPSGIAFSPDEKTLYISNADPLNAVWMAFDVKPDGTIEKGRVLFNAAAWTKTKPGVPDGMKVDKEGNIFGAGPGGVYVIAPDGTHLGTIDLNAPTGNVAWGEDGSTLFIASNRNVYRVKLTTKGAVF
ncbi:MAG: SMP-30/gluconolactonase/LRE family protein [Candidatus Binatia bacterium]